MKDSEAYEVVWKKYLPVIVMKLKQAIRNNSSSTIGLYKAEFQSAGSKRKTGYEFNLEMKQGRVVNTISIPPVARDLSEMLKQDLAVKQLINGGHFQFSLASDFVLTIEKKD